MTKVLKCRDVGLDCDFVARGDTVEEIMKQAGQHAQEVHGMTEISPQVAEMVRAAIQDESAATA